MAMLNNQRVNRKIESQGQKNRKKRVFFYVFFLGHGSGICLERELVQFMIRTVFGRPWTFGELKKNPWHSKRCFLRPYHQAIYPLVNIQKAIENCHL